MLGKALLAASDAVHLLIAGLAGGWGAGFSMLASLKTRLDAADLNDLKLLKSKWILWSRPRIGVGAACILFFFLYSGLLGGAAFPALKSDQASAATSAPPAGQAGGPTTNEGVTPAKAVTEAAQTIPRKDLALLIV